MPEFILEGRDHAARQESEFVLGFIEAMFFTESAPGITSAEWFRVPKYIRNYEGQLPCDVGYTDLHPDSLVKIRAICEAWQRKNASLLDQAYWRGYELAQAGRDFWFTGNGHGVGFSDRDELRADDLGEKLDNAALYHLENYHAFFGDHVTHGSAPFVHFD